MLQLTESVCHISYESEIFCGRENLARDLFDLDSNERNRRCCARTDWSSQRMFNETTISFQKRNDADGGHVATLEFVGVSSPSRSTPASHSGTVNNNPH